MQSIYGIAALLITGMMTCIADSAGAQSYPSKPIRIVTGAVGGSSDFGARLLAQGIAAPLGQAVIVDNRGGSVVIAADAVAKAAPDGYTLIYYASSFWLAPYMLDNPGYDPVKDFAPITLTVSAPAILVVHPSLPVKSIKELIALAKARPGALNYGSSGAGTTPHLAAELFKSMAGVNIVRIFYKGVSPAVNGLLSGQVQLLFATASSVQPQVKAQKLRALGVASAQPSALLPGMPTLASTGLPGYEYETLSGIFSTAKTPPAVITKLNQEIVRFLNTPEMKERLANIGLEPVGNTPEQFAAAVKSDMTRLGKVIKDSGINAE